MNAQLVQNKERPTMPRTMGKTCLGVADRYEDMDLNARV